MVMRKKMVVQNLWLVMGLFWAMFVFPMISQADQTLTADFTRVSDNDLTYSEGGDYIGGTGDFSEGTPDNSSYPQVDSVKANYANNGVLTNRTTQIKARFSDDPIAFGMGATISSFQLAVFNGHDVNSAVLTPSLLTGAAMPNLGGPYTTSITLPTSTVTFNVDLTHLSTDFPVYIGYQLTAASAGNYSGSACYELAQLSAPIMTTKPTITGTAPDSTAEHVKVLSTDHQIVGTGNNPGDSLLVEAQTGADSAYEPLGKTTVKDDHQFELKLPAPLTKMTSVRVTETNDTADATGGYTGATATTTAAVERIPITITASTQTVDFVPADLDNLVSDHAVIQWLVQRAGIKAVSYNDQPVTYAAKESGLSQQLSGLADNATQTIDIYAQAGTATTKMIPVTVMKQPGILAFGTGFPAISFGTHALPATEEKLAPTSNVTIPVMDTQVAGASWTLSATASPLTAAAKTLNGGICYQATDGSVQLLTNHSVVVATGSRTVGQTTFDPTEHWTFAANNQWQSSAVGVFLDALPGTGMGQYQGQIEWTLDSTPTQ